MAQREMLVAQKGGGAGPALFVTSRAAPCERFGTVTSSVQSCPGLLAASPIVVPRKHRSTNGALLPKAMLQPPDLEPARHLPGLKPALHLPGLRPVQHLPQPHLGPRDKGLYQSGQ